MSGSRPVRIGVGMMSVRTSADSAKAGVSRYALAIVEALAIAAPAVEFEVYTRPDFEPPSTWGDLANLRLHRVRIYKAVQFGAGWRPPVLGYRAWFARPDPDWHWQQAQRFEKDQSWFAAKFHCEQVLKSRPDDAAAKALLEKAKAEWEKKN